MAYNIPNITVVEKKQVWLIDVAIPGDHRIHQKRGQKDYEVPRPHYCSFLWEKKATVVPVVIGTLGAIPEDVEKHLKIQELDKISPSQLKKQHC